MRLLVLCALVAPMCRMAEDAAVRRALEDLSGGAEDYAPLAAAMRRHGEDARRVMTLMGSGDEPTAESLRRRFHREALAFFYLCGQCTPAELLSVLTRCTVTPTAEAIALLVSERRREQAERLYGLQLLWRMQDDPALPEAMALFSPGAAQRSAEDVIRSLQRRLKEMKK